MRANRKQNLPVRIVIQAAVKLTRAGWEYKYYNILRKIMAIRNGVPSTRGEQLLWGSFEFNGARGLAAKRLTHVVRIHLRTVRS